MQKRNNTNAWNMPHQPMKNGRAGKPMELAIVIDVLKNS